MAATQDEFPAGIFLQNLVTNKDSWKLARHIFRMLTLLGVYNRDIVSIIVDQSKGNAVVHLRTKEVEEFAVKAFSDIRYVMNYFDVRKIVTKPTLLKVTKQRVYVTYPSQNSMNPNKPNEPVAHVSSKRRTKRKHKANVETIQVFTGSDGKLDGKNDVDLDVENDVDPDGELDDDLDDECEGQIDVEAGGELEGEADGELDGESNSGPSTNNDIYQERQLEDPSTAPSATSSISTAKTEFEPLVDEDTSAVRSIRSASTSMSAFPDSNSTEEPWGSPKTARRFNPVMVDVKTSTPECSPCFCPETVFYHRDQHVGNESRHVEFKRGGVITDLRSFRNTVGKYLCAFLNTEGGTIYFGVTDDGKAIGISVSQKMEDQIRLMIDTAVSTIKPNVPTSAYTINFAKIMNENGKIDQTLRVLEVCVKPRDTPAMKHSFDNNIYVRRDGSLRTVDK